MSQNHWRSQQTAGETATVVGLCGGLGNVAQYTASGWCLQPAHDFPVAVPLQSKRTAVHPVLP
jgi:hypothetical protein